MISEIQGFAQEIKNKAFTKLNSLPEPVKATWKVRAFSLMKIPMIAFLGPRIIESTDEKMSLKIPMGYRSRNHLNSMYFGALAVGADLVVGLLAQNQIEKSPDRIQLVFKDFKANYLKRAEGDVLFTCDEGQGIAELVAKAAESEDRVNQTFKAYATVPSKFGDEPVATFELTLSLKKKTPRSKDTSSKTAANTAQNTTEQPATEEQPDQNSPENA